MIRIAVALVCLSSAFAQQIPDPKFDASVAHPAYPKRHPAVLFDEAHNNFHRTDGRYKPFATLLTNDGYTITPNREAFRAGTLRPYRVLVIANALGSAAMGSADASKPAFTADECRAVREWVERGGRLLLIADHAPMGAANQILARELGVTMGEGFTYDPRHSAEGAPSVLEFSRDNGLLANHAITRGRNASERISKVVAFTGQSLKGPPAGATILRLADSAFDKADRTSIEQRAVAGPSQCIVFRSGKGRVVVLGEAAMLSAQLGGANQRPMGMNVPGNDDRQFALNLMHWLTGLLK